MGPMMLRPVTDLAAGFDFIARNWFIAMIA
jgi:hypothetical protein